MHAVWVCTLVTYIYTLLSKCRSTSTGYRPKREVQNAYKHIDKKAIDLKSHTVWCREDWGWLSQGLVHWKVHLPFTSLPSAVTSHIYKITKQWLHASDVMIKISLKTCSAAFFKGKKSESFLKG